MDAYLLLLLNIFKNISFQGRGLEEYNFYLDRCTVIGVSGCGKNSQGLLETIISGPIPVAQTGWHIKGATDKSALYMH